MKTYNLLEQDALNFLRENCTAVVSTCFEGRPHATVVYYDIDPEFNFYYLTKQNTQKNIHTAFDPNVAIVVGFGPERISVQARGKADVLSGEEKQVALTRLLARYTSEGIERLPIEHMKNLREEKVVVYKIIPTEIMFMNMDSKRYSKSISDSYHKII